MWVSLQRRSNANRARRYVGGLAISVAVHLIVAAVLSVRFLAPAVERAAREFTVAVVAWTPPNLAPTVRKAAPPASPAPEPADAPEPEKPSASMSSFAGVAGPMAVRGVRDPATLTARRIELAARDDAPFIERNDRIGSVVGNRPSSLPAFSALLDGSARATGEVVPVSLPEGSLSGQSPEVSREPGVTAARRGIGFENAGAGSYGSNASPIEGVSNGVYRNLMQGIARGIVANTETRELDIVFVVDTTASMVDNVRGVQAYADEFVNLLIADRRNVRFGLVTFADAAVEKPKTRGFTEKSSEFRTWLGKAEFEGGGDLAESALDAVMEGARRLKFRRKAQPYLILLSDGPFHDRDHDGQSRYTLDEVIAELKADRIVVDVVGLDYLPVKQLAWGTG
ncbi:VWA domain-containing protein, partial [Candidatus Poribacteria bacterium]|nr:VWA domain-containing protein [Candidatus Poribacteria bacterium]